MARNDEKRERERERCDVIEKFTSVFKKQQY